MQRRNFKDGARRRVSSPRKSVKNRQVTSKEAAASIESIANSPALWFATCAKILTKDQQLLTPDPNRYQLRILEVYEWCMANGVPCPILALKPHQKGSSTVSAALVYHHC